MDNNLERLKSIQQVFEGEEDEVLKKASYKLEGLDEKEKERQLAETVKLHEHLKKIEESGAAEEISQEELGGTKLPEGVRSPEELQEYEKCLKSAENILDMFDLKPGKEDFLVITDTKVMKVNPGMVEAVMEQAKKLGVEFRVMVAPESKKSATPFSEEFGDRMAGRPVLILTARSRSHSEQTRNARSQERVLFEKAVLEWDKIIQSERFNKAVIRGWSGIAPDRLQQLKEEGVERGLDSEKYKKLCEERNARVVSITKGHNPEGILTEGPALEDIETIRDKGEKVNELMKEVEKVHITSAKGTDLWLYPMTKYQDFEDGKIDKPGKISNFPIGEWSCSVRLKGTNGILVIDGPCGGGLDRHLIGAGIKLEGIKDGRIGKIEGVKHQEGKQILEDLAGQDEKAAGLLKTIEGGDLDEIFEVITREDLPEIWRAIKPEKQSALKSYLAAERLKNYLEVGNRDYRVKNPEDKKAEAFKLAELGIGTNTKAKAPHNKRSTNGEKEYGTVHFGTGGNGAFGVPRNDINFNNIAIHCDMVHDQPTVECFKKDGTKFNLIEEGRPVGY